MKHYIIPPSWPKSISTGCCILKPQSQTCDCPPGPQGPQGAQGPQGPQGPGLTGFQIVTQTVTSTAGVATLTITCPINNIAISAGFSIAGGNQVRITQMQPAVGPPPNPPNNPNQWIFRAEGQGAQQFTLTGFVICAQIV
jgi:hypothetical protein